MKMMKTTRILLSAAMTLALTGCADDDEYTFRGGSLDPDHPQLQNRDPDVKLYADEPTADDDDDDDDILIWDITNDTDVHDADGNLVLTIENVREVYDADGNLTCIIEDGELKSPRVRTAVDGEAVGDPILILEGTTVYDADGEAVVSVISNRVKAGSVARGRALWFGSENLAKGTPFRKVLLGALATGHCL